MSYDMSYDLRRRLTDDIAGIPTTGRYPDDEQERPQIIRYTTIGGVVVPIREGELSKVHALLAEQRIESNKSFYS